MGLVDEKSRGRCIDRADIYCFASAVAFFGALCREIYLVCADIYIIRV